MRVAISIEYRAACLFLGNVTCQLINEREEINKKAGRSEGRNINTPWLNRVSAI